MPRAFFSDSFNDIHELKYGQAEEKLEAGGDEKLIFNFIWPICCSADSCHYKDQRMRGMHDSSPGPSAVRHVGLRQHSGSGDLCMWLQNCTATEISTVLTPRL